MKAVEILAPAGNPESFERAWAAGADAVYLGYSAFSARAGAGNFNREQLEAAIRSAHLHHMRVYVTVNTLVKDSELPGVMELLGMLEKLKADGILVQDIGVLRLAGKFFPGLNIHASTQMAVHNAAGVRWCASMGMTRVVLARECSLEEIRRCAAEGPEIEVFAHGAQCVAVSGLCLFSSMVGGRSGNRGRCAQPCRMLYTLDDAEKNAEGNFRGGEARALLSPRDVCLRDDIPAIVESGAASLKLEGRLKRPEYVAVVTDSYRRGVDSLTAGSFRLSDEEEKRALRQIFNRGDFMRGYAFGCEDAGVISPESANHRGIEIGRVEACAGEMARVRVTEGTLRDGDGLRLSREGKTGEEKELIYSGKEVPAGGIALLRLRRGIKAAEGDRVYRLTDSRQLEEARRMEGKRIPVDMSLQAWPGKPLSLTVTDGESRVSAEGPVIQKAERRESTAEEMERGLRKTGGTAFVCGDVSVKTAGAFVPVSVLNALRRDALEQLAEERIAAFESKSGGFSGETEYASHRAKIKAIPTVTVRTDDRGAEIKAIPAVTVRTAEQAEAARDAGETVAWYPEDYRSEALGRLEKHMRQGDWLRLPEVCEEGTLEYLRDWISRHRNILGGVVLGTVGQLGMKWEVPFGAGGGIPVMNREAARLLREQGCVFVTASPELTGEELKRLTEMDSDGENITFAVSVYGRTQLMLLHHCPARTAIGLRKGHKGCGLCDEGDSRSLKGKRLTDRKGFRFPLYRQRLPEGCLVRLMNALPTDNMDKRIPGEGERVIRTAEFIGESGAETERILTGLREHIRGSEPSTRGHWNRETE